MNSIDVLFSRLASDFRARPFNFAFFSLLRDSDFSVWLDATPITWRF